ncbi:aftiphilin isoform X2 [Thrips palmi]|nr:aftiphilin isoform X2 [Thrips palmi]XP_034249984.1 aftiphilin isoform X2 [Thrips palmi]XP_034249985.1 aftiphilin isoform X2 [Thrips palmi]XP_034249986.1 aftiphilin isoform X2 [Thrips palmi]XP_034249987.1 aftiphilin isoform X2 [Thrips palmi]
MQNIIPPIVSSSPPPLDPIDDDNDEDDNEDEFGDFSVADFGSSADSAMQKSIPDTSWKLPTLKSDVLENGVVSLKLPVEDTPPQSQTEALEDEELFENGDNASHDSVVSAITDSGNCSASQNSNGTSPMPGAEVEDEAVLKSDACHLQQNGGTCETPCNRTDSGVQNCTVPVPNQILSDFCEARDIDENRTLNISNNSLADGSYQQSACTLVSSPAKKFSDEFSSTELVVDQNEGSKAQVVIANNPVEQKSDTTSFPSVMPKSNNDDSDEFGVWNSSTVPLKLNNFQSIDSQSNLGSEPKSDPATLAKVSKTEVSKGFNGLEDHDCVRGMIIPDIPGLGDFDGDEDDDDDFGEFRGIESPGKCSSDAQSIDESMNDAQFQSPSRRPTLVLSDNIVTDMSDTQSPSTVEKNKDASQQPTDASSIEINISSLEENSSVLCQTTKEEINVMPSTSLHSSEIPAFADEFADFSQAEIEENPASDGWAQAARASAIQNTMPSQDPLEFDDFDDYESAEFQSADPKPNIAPCPNSHFDLNKIRSTLGEVLKENFPVPAESNMSTEMENMGTNGLSGLILDIEESPVWQGLRDLEATPSISFQWPGSHANRGLLGALNIDSRNILFGPKWNTVVPRFAANLGFSPLEPVRAVQNQPPSEPSPRPEVIQPQVVESIKRSSSEHGEVVPAAQFDWNDSGLTNPLDSSTHSSLLDLDLLASFDNLASCPSQPMSTSHAAVVCRSLLTTKDPNNGALATTAASGNPAMTTTPLQVEQLLASSKRTAPLNSLERKTRDPTLSPEAVRVLDTLPELAFLSARMLMFPVHGDRNENKL